MLNDFITKNLSKQDRIEMATTFLQKLFGNLPKDKFFTYLWVLSPDKKVKRTISFCVNGDFEPIAQKAIQLNDEGNHVFFGVNLTDSPMDENHRATEKDIRLQTAIITDIDIQGSWHVGEKYPANFEQAKNFLPFEPSILVDSGRGLHAYTLLDKPTRFTTDEERKQAETMNRAYIQMVRQKAGMFAGAVDSVHDLPRVLRLPGTYNLKSGRANAPLCQVVGEGNAYTLENLHERIKSSPITPAENPHAELKNRADSLVNRNNLTEQERALKMLGSFSASSLTYDEWLQVGMGLKTNGNSCTDWERWSATDSARFKEGECEKKWLGFDRNDIRIATLHYFAKKYGNYSERACQSERHNDKKNVDGANSPEKTNSKLSDKEKSELFNLPHTDLENSERLLKFYGQEIRFMTDSCRWLTYQKNLWQDEGRENSAILPYALKMSKTISDNAETETEKKLARQWQMRKTYGNAIEILKGFDSIRITEQDLNTHNNLLNCQNGVIDLQTGTLYPHDSKLLMTQCINAEYRAGYRNNRVDDFLHGILPDESTLHSLLRYLGYCLTGSIRAEKALFIHGTGGNGKGTLSKTLLNLFGDYGVGFPIESILVQPRIRDADSATPAFASLQWCRLAISEEIPSGRKLDYAKFKILTGGDSLPIRKLFQESSTIKNPTHKMIFSGNHLPELDDTHDAGILRRWIQIRFEQDFTGANCDDTLKEFLSTPDALAALLNILVENAVAWYKEGLIISDKMQSDRTSYFAENDYISEFINEFCVQNNTLSTSRKEFLQALKTEYPNETRGKSDRVLTSAITKIEGITYKRSTGGGYKFFGLALRDSERQENFGDDFCPPPDINDTP